MKRLTRRSLLGMLPALPLSLAISQLVQRNTVRFDSAKLPRKAYVVRGSVVNISGFYTGNTPTVLTLRNGSVALAEVRLTPQERWQVNWDTSREAGTNYILRLMQQDARRREVQIGRVDIELLDAPPCTLKEFKPDVAVGDLLELNFDWTIVLRPDTYAVSIDGQSLPAEKPWTAPLRLSMDGVKPGKHTLVIRFSTAEGSVAESAALTFLKGYPLTISGLPASRELDVAALMRTEQTTIPLTLIAKFRMIEGVLHEAL